MGNRIRGQIGRMAGVALAVATFLSAGSARAQNAGPVGAIQDPVAETNQVLALMNQERAKVGAPPLTRHCLLDKAAQSHAEDMAKNNFFGHYSSNGALPGDRIRAAGYTTLGPGAENVAAVATTAAAVVAAWMASTQGHREAMLNSAHLEVGIGVAYGAATQYRYYWVADFKGGPGPACTPTGGTGGTGGTVAQPRSLGGVATAAPRAAYDADGRLYVFVRGTDGAVWYRSRSDLTSNWADWISLGGFIKDNLSLGTVSGRLAVFARGGDDALWYTVRQGNGFAPWASLGGTITAEPAAAQVGGRARVVVRGVGGVPYYRAQNDTGQWLDWKNLGGGITGAPVVTLGSDGRLIILAQGGGGFWLHPDPELVPGETWKYIGLDGVSDPVLAPGAPASSPVIMWPNSTNLQWSYLSGGQWLGGASVFGDGSPCSRTITSRIAVAPRPAGGFYLATRRDGGHICVLAEAVSAESGLTFLGNVWTASNVSGASDLSVVADSRDGRAVVFSLDANGGLEERWF